MPLIIPDVPVDEDGLAIFYHFLSHHRGNGEVTLCDLYIDYDTWKGTAPGAQTCPDCMNKGI